MHAEYVINHQNVYRWIANTSHNIATEYLRILGKITKKKLIRMYHLHDKEEENYRM